MLIPTPDATPTPTPGQTQTPPPFPITFPFNYPYHYTTYCQLKPLKQSNTYLIATESNSLIQLHFPNNSTYHIIKEYHISSSLFPSFFYNILPFFSKPPQYKIISLSYLKNYLIAFITNTSTFNVANIHSQQFNILYTANENSNTKITNAKIISKTIADMNNEYEPFKVKKFYIVYTFQSELNTFIKTLTITFNEINMSTQKFNLHDYEDYYNEINLGNCYEIANEYTCIKKNHLRIEDIIFYNNKLMLLYNNGNIEVMFINLLTKNQQEIYNERYIVINTINENVVNDVKELKVGIFGEGDKNETVFAIDVNNNEYIIRDKSVHCIENIGDIIQEYVDNIKIMKSENDYNNVIKRIRYLNEEKQFLFILAILYNNDNKNTYMNLLSSDIIISTLIENKINYVQYIKDIISNIKKCLYNVDLISQINNLYQLVKIGKVLFYNRDKNKSDIYVNTITYIVNKIICNYEIILQCVYNFIKWINVYLEKDNDININEINKMFTHSKIAKNLYNEYGKSIINRFNEDKLFNVFGVDNIQNIVNYVVSFFIIDCEIMDITKYHLLFTIYNTYTKNNNNKKNLLLQLDMNTFRNIMNNNDNTNEIIVFHIFMLVLTTFSNNEGMFKKVLKYIYFNINAISETQRKYLVNFVNTLIADNSFNDIVSVSPVLYIYNVLNEIITRNKKQISQNITNIFYLESFLFITHKHLSNNNLDIHTQSFIKQILPKVIVVYLQKQQLIPLYKALRINEFMSKTFNTSIIELLLTTNDTNINTNSNMNLTLNQLLNENDIINNLISILNENKNESSLFVLKQLYYKTKQYEQCATIAYELSNKFNTDNNNCLNDVMLFVSKQLEYLNESIYFINKCIEIKKDDLKYASFKQTVTSLSKFCYVKLLILKIYKQHPHIFANENILQQLTDKNQILNYVFKLQIYEPIIKINLVSFLSSQKQSRLFILNMIKSLSKESKYKYLLCSFVNSIIDNENKYYLFESLLQFKQLTYIDQLQKELNEINKERTSNILEKYIK